MFASFLEMWRSEDLQCLGGTQGHKVSRWWSGPFKPSLSCLACSLVPYHTTLKDRLCSRATSKPELWAWEQELIWLAMISPTRSTYKDSREKPRAFPHPFSWPLYWARPFSSIPFHGAVGSATLKHPAKGPLPLHASEEAATLWLLGRNTKVRHTSVKGIKKKKLPKNKNGKQKWDPWLCPLVSHHNVERCSALETANHHLRRYFATFWLYDHRKAAVFFLRVSL